MALDIGRRLLGREATTAAAEGRRTPSVVIVGAGLSGLAMGIQLARSGVRTFTIVEQSDGVGGTWRDNTYPGCGCDVPSHLYSLSFAPKTDWTRRYAAQPEILSYAESCIERFGLGPHLRLGTAVRGARFNDGRGDWEIELEAHDHLVDVIRADTVVFACGQLNRPHIPAIAGLSSFGGPWWHSARWDHGCDLAGKRVAVIGSGASAIQFVPEVAAICDRLTVFERSPNYVVPKKDRSYRRAERRLLERVRALELVYRWWIYWSLEVRWLWFRKDSWASRALSGLVTREIRNQVVSDRLPERTIVPDYPIGCKRILISSDWFPTLRRPDVTVVDEPVDHIEPDAVVTTDGKRHHADVVVFGTGFETTDFLGHLSIRGQGGRTLAEEWSGGARAYLGTAMPGFPNCYLLYGPNTNLGHNSILFMVERQISLILQALAVQARALSDHARPLVGVDPAAYGRDDRRTQRMVRRTAWVANCRSWYKDASGRVTNNWPSWTVRYWLDTLRLHPSDLGITGSVPVTPHHRTPVVGGLDPEVVTGSDGASAP